MKLLDIVPFLVETAAEDDPFAESPRPKVSRELINILERRLIAINHETHRVKQSIFDVLRKTPGCYYMWDYPGGSILAQKDIDAGKLIKVKIDNDWGRTRRRSRGSTSIYVIPNTPEGQNIIRQIDTKKHRVYQLIRLAEQIHTKLVRDRRTVEARKTKMMARDF